MTRCQLYVTLPSKNNRLKNKLRNMLKYEKGNLYSFSLELLSSIRKNVIKDIQIPYHEICLAIGCFLKINESLPPTTSMDDDETFNYLNELHSKETITSKFVEQAHLYSIPNFKYLIKHLRNVGVLHKIIIDILHNIETKIEKKEWNYLKYDIITSCYDDYFPEDIIITRCGDGTFATRGEYDKALEEDYKYIKSLDLYDYYPTHSNVYHEEAACIWPFSDGYARVIGKDGRWGYLSQEDNTIKWLDFNVKPICGFDGKVVGVDMEGSVLYADDFKCERARVQLDNENNTYMYVGLCLDDCFGKTFKNASEFENGYAVVSDDYCDNYIINVFGEIVDSDKKRYEECKLNTIEGGNGEYELARGSKRNGYYDPETEIMNSLSGHGADPELFGF